MASACGKWQSESRRFCALCNLNHTTRANIAHEKAEQIRARIACTPAEKEWRGRGWSKCADGTESVLFIFSIDYTWVLSCRGRRYPVSATPSNAPRMYQFSPLSVDDTAFPKRRAKTLMVRETLLKAKGIICKKAGEPAFFIILHIR